MAMKMDRRAFLKTSAAMAMAVSMTGLLGGCSDGAGSTDLGGFTASVTKWDVRQNPPALSEDQSKWTADVMVWVRTTNTKVPTGVLRATPLWSLKSMELPLQCRAAVC